MSKGELWFLILNSNRKFVKRKITDLSLSPFSSS
nr:MAG TPA: hypothetical protein [Caudoviricetes sp.]